jgi:hypothetical protein
MAARHALAFGLCFLLWLGCGDDSPSVTPIDTADSGKDAGGSGSGGSKPDSGHPQTNPDAGKTDAGSGGRDAGQDASVDSGLPVAVDGGGGDIDIPPSRPPSEWTCAAALWADGYCDCGCGAADSDCVGQSCTGLGCIAATCDACYTETHAWKSCSAPPNPSGWHCSAAEQFDMYNCDCGCGVPDEKCGGSGCSEPGCWRRTCNARHDADGGVLDDMLPPFNGWTCPAAAWGGGDGCDCGCGVPDPDCQYARQCETPLCNADACNHCHDKTGRSVPCADELSNAWTCDPQRYGSGDGCDCGCGAADPDCVSQGCTAYGCRDGACKRCTDTNYASNTSVGCAGADVWTCELSHYGTNDGCDCGCGIADPDCGSGANCTGAGCQADACAYCHAGSVNNAANYDPRSDSDYIPCDGWTCGSKADAAWKNAECDCGCGRPDPYCRLGHRKSCVEADCQTATCEFCNAQNGSRAACGGPTWSTSGTCKAQNYGLDGLCDCGCGALDPDCAQDEGCADPLCAAKGCEVCHGPGALLATCYTWKCPAAAYGDGTTCDCGCGAPDPDCSGYGCIEPGCREAMCSPEGCHDPFGRAVKCP